MLLVKEMIIFILFSCINGLPHINLDLTDQTNEGKEKNVVYQHDCFHVAAWMEKESDPYQIISYCMSEWPSKWNIQKHNRHQNFTFADLYQRNITSQQLYLWSAPLDVMERYQSYLNLVTTTNTAREMASQVYYNCTLPRFGSMCQYSFDFDISDYGSLNEIIHGFYRTEYEPTTLTCYDHLECDRGSKSLCLDWTEICDGTVDCRDGVDEESCWKVEVHECEENEYRCLNGQCIPKTFINDDLRHFDCLDRSDRVPTIRNYAIRIVGEPTITIEDIMCDHRIMLFSAKLTSSCGMKRSTILEKLMFSDKPENVSDACWLAVKCQLALPGMSNLICFDLSFNQTLTEIINETCPDQMYIPDSVVTFGHMSFLYTKENMFQQYRMVPPPQFVCYNDQLCSGFYSNRTLISFNNATCRRPMDFPLQSNTHGNNRGLWNPTYVFPLFQTLYQCNTVDYSGTVTCDNLTMYRCMNSSKCIPKYRICDGLKDCDYNDDERCSPVNGSCPEYESNKLFKCTVDDRCISSILVEDGKCDCRRDQYNICEDEESTKISVKTRISFPTICDGFTELIPMIIDGRVETDETDCDYWQCNNTYTRCDRFWNCIDGADEVDCDPSPLISCPHHHHICVSPETYQFICLPLIQANDGHIDCLGATDELTMCSRDEDLYFNNLYCNISGHSSCVSTINDCLADLCYNDYSNNLYDEIENDTTNISTTYDDDCTIARNNMKQFMEKRPSDNKKSEMVHFALPKMNSEQIKSGFTNDLAIISDTPRQVQQHDCHRGIPLRVWIDEENNVSNKICLCPPSYYGEICQYQNERVSLTLQLQAYSDSRQTLFAIIVTFIDDSDERMIHSYLQFSYLYVRDCQNKFNMYLLYSTQPKNTTKHYSIHVDIYEKMSLTYRGSFFIPLEFPFLPVHRVAVQFNIPRSTEKPKSCSNRECLHGQCVKYSNDLKEHYFCRCHPRWSGQSCHIPHYCRCSSDSLCLGKLNTNRSLCVCRGNKWGSQCLFQNHKCDSDQNMTCSNHGQCLPTDEHIVSSKKMKCICEKGFSGERCEINTTQMILSFYRDIHLPKAILIHFIQVMNNGSPQNGSIFMMIPVNQRTITIYWSYAFHIAIAEFSKKDYYLLTVKNTLNHSMIISKTISSTDRCKHLGEVLNETIAKYPLLRRIKYYHLTCQKQSPLLSCFYDENHFCLCDDYGKERLANCFEFNSTKVFDCFGKSNCRNDAQCLQDKTICPQTSICICPVCFYGTLCQFSSSGFGLSLDAILGYHIQPHVNITQQPPVVQISIIIMILMTIAGLINGILSLITFKNTVILNTVCGIFLFSSSITTLITIMIFTMKFWILLVAQTTNLRNRLFLQIQCISIDFLLQVSVNLQQWLHACIAIERGMTAIQKTNQMIERRRRMTKYTIVILLVFNILTIIHDPIRRQIIFDDNDDEKRTWCIITYSSSLQSVSTTINIFHFITPFIINLISAPVIIIITARQRTMARTNQSYQQILYEQLQKHKHLITSPIVLVILALPRLIISFVSGCMKSVDNPWLYVIGYFISFLPSMLTFAVFILPSTFYREEFSKTYQRYRNII